MKKLSVKTLEKTDTCHSQFECNCIRNINEALGFKILHVEVKNFIFFKKYTIFSKKHIVPTVSEVCKEVDKSTLFDHQLIPIHNFLIKNRSLYSNQHYSFMMEFLFDKNREIDDQIKLQKLLR